MHDDLINDLREAKLAIFHPLSDIERAAKAAVDRAINKLAESSGTERYKIMSWFFVVDIPTTQEVQDMLNKADPGPNYRLVNVALHQQHLLVMWERREYTESLIESAVSRALNGAR